MYANLIRPGFILLLNLVYIAQVLRQAHRESESGSEDTPLPASKAYHTTPGGAIVLLWHSVGLSCRGLSCGLAVYGGRVPRCAQRPARSPHPHSRWLPCSRL